MKNSNAPYSIAPPLYCRIDGVRLGEKRRKNNQAKSDFGLGDFPTFLYGLPFLLLGKAPLHGVLDKLIGILQAQFYLNIGIMGVDGFHAYIQFTSDFFGGISLTCQL